MDFELEELAGASCIHSGKKILVAADATHCDKCGRAVLKKHKSEHEEKCTGAGAIKRVAHDYDEEPPVTWTSTLIGFVAAGVFVAALGGGLMMASPEQPPGELAKPLPTKKLGAGFGLMALGAIVGVGGYNNERKKQLAKK
ncbi:MAG: hypothetical protein JNK05_18735 [Myxococcales bacterium]|nr:hypothetical protein [Myxococcales bacterium]